jgi:hypothetical protein
MNAAPPQLPFDHLSALHSERVLARAASEQPTSCAIAK